MGMKRAGKLPGKGTVRKRILRFKEQSKWSKQDKRTSLERGDPTLYSVW